MEPPLYMRSVTDRNVVMRHLPVFGLYGITVLLYIIFGKVMM